MTITNPENNTHSVTVEKRIARPSSEVFKAIGEGRLFFNCGTAMSSAKIDFRKGGKYTIQWPQYGFQNQGEFTDVTPFTLIAFTWIQDPTNSDTPDTQVTIDLISEGSETLVKIRHSGFRNPETAKQHEGGWTSGLKDLGTEMTEGKLLLIRPIEMPVNQLFEKCLKPETIFGQVGDLDRGSADVRTGGRFEVPNKNGKASGKFLEIDPGKKMVFTWENGCDNEPLPDSRVTLSFDIDDDDANHSWIELTHSGLNSEKQQKSHREGWEAILGEIANHS